MSASVFQTRAFPGALPLGLARAAGEPGPAGEVRLRVALSELPAAASILRDDGARLATVTSVGDPEPSLVLVCALRGALVVLRAPVSDADVLPQIGSWWPAARWPERELAERLPGAAARPRLTAPDADELDRQVDGLDVFAIPYGPVRSGIFEAIQFQIETGGESVLALRTRPFFKRRGLEERMRGLSVDRAVYVAERIAGIAAVAYASAFSQAVERAVGIEVAPVAEHWRAVHGELERIACHLDIVAKQAETTALSVGQARFQILKERIMRLRAQLSGSRFGRGVIVPGGVRARPDIDAVAVRSELDDFERQFRRDRTLFAATASMTDRLIGSGVLTRELVEDYGGVGPLARGSGLAVDARHERPYGAYRRLGLQLMTRPEGDAMARVNVRFDEIAESLRILRQALDRTLDVPDAGPIPVRATGAAWGWAEAPQGELLVWVEVSGGVVGHVHVASPSLRNWALFDHAFPRDVLTDFAFIEHSFGLTSAGADR
jgi:formate hydrogenlyase subunit 5